jgi:fumarylacetoacetate (FAA) hydrolase
VKVAHVREQHAPAGTPWRLAAALDPGDSPGRWLDLEVARRRLVAADRNLPHDQVLFRQPVSTLDDHLARGLRVAALGDVVEGFAAAGGPRDADDDAVLDATDMAFGPPILRPLSVRDFYAFEVHVATVWRRRGGEIPEAWFRLPVFYFSNVSEIRGPGEPVWAPRTSAELDFELEVGALVDTPAFDLPAGRAEEAIGGYFVLNDWSARDLQRDETTVRLGPAKGKDFATSIGPWLVTPDEVADRHAPGTTGPDLAMTAAVAPAGGAAVEISRGSWASAQYSFAEMLARACADVHVRPGEILGSGTVGTGCLLESREATLGRWLAPGDTVALTIERLGTLRSPVVARPAR